MLPCLLKLLFVWVTALRCAFRSTCCLLFYYFNRLWRLPLNPRVHSSAAGDVAKERDPSARPIFHLVAQVRNATGSEESRPVVICSCIIAHSWSELSKNGVFFGICLFRYFWECCCYHTYHEASESLPFFLLAVGVWLRSRCLLPSLPAHWHRASRSSFT